MKQNFPKPGGLCRWSKNAPPLFWNIAGRLRCDFQTDNIPEESLPPRIQHELLRFAQETISKAVRTLSLQW
jgi:hypothetical protein